MSRPQVVAHRGASEDVAEHTLASYQRALDDGADALECDVRLTRDGHLVCVHDRRLERTSDGRGVLSTKRLEELAALDWDTRRSAWADLDDEAEPPDHNAGKILTLHDLLAMVHDWHRPVQVAIETKHPVRYSGWVEQRLVQTLAGFGWAQPVYGAEVPVRVMSFSVMSLSRLRRMAPAVSRVLLVKSDVPAAMRAGRLPPGVTTVGLQRRLVRAHPRWVGRLQERGNAVHVWVVNDLADVDLCTELGVEALITDRPRAVRAHLERST